MTILLKNWPTLELNGRTITDYETDFYGVGQEEIDTGTLLFTYAAFDDKDKSLTDNQLVILSSKYRWVVYLMSLNYLSKDSPKHKKYANHRQVLEFLKEDNLWASEEEYEADWKSKYTYKKIDISMPIDEFLDQYV